MSRSTCQPLGPVIVTGAARGIGAAIARRLASDGRPVAAVDLDPVPESVGAALRLRADVADPASVSRAVAQVREAMGPVDGVVNNAGIGGPFRRVDEVDDDEWLRVMHTNVRSVFLIARAVLPDMKARGAGRIVNIASVHGRFGAARSSTYVASKHAVIGYTRALAAEWGGHGITCNAVSPGYIDTRMGAQAEAGDDHRLRIERRTPAGRLGRPEEVAGLVAWLLGPDSAYVNGAVMTIDGGLSADVGIG